MIIEVVGYKGVVGNATYKWLKAMHPELEIIGRDIGDEISEYQETNVDPISYICVPEGMVKQVCRNTKTNLFVIRSTVPPGTCSEIEKETGIHTCHLPEFLKEATAEIDEFNQIYLLLGACCERHAEMLQDIYEPIISLVPVNRETTEIVKLSMNCYFSTLISFWNEIETIAKKVGVSGHAVGMLASLDGRISDYGARYHHKFGGKCLPKDTRQVQEFAKKIGVKTPLLDAVMEVNECQEY